MVEYAVENPVIRVLVCADSEQELAALERIIRESDWLELVGSSVGYDRMSELLEEARPDVTLDRGAVDDSEIGEPTEPFEASVGSLASAATPRREERPMPEVLSRREREILNLVATGLGNKQIASQLHISEHTVKFHLTSIFNKLNASSRAEAVAIGARRGLILF